MKGKQYICVRRYNKQTFDTFKEKAEHQTAASHLSELWLPVWFGAFVSVTSSHLEVPDDTRQRVGILYLWIRKQFKHGGILTLPIFPILYFYEI